ncbi:hypothetical protein BDW42DRAFT_22548 [Aspergillus taichungensis]|uniref:Uncharacterized protein n=1 Tax=Aspergillus taichungensis TaxID=482145 RepID=A0A2J5HH67_9EURO|nr:hypothetical protein BDW42DRAFT_22548 [Aspergillus taichungensis]
MRRPHPVSNQVGSAQSRDFHSRDGSSETGPSSPEVLSRRCANRCCFFLVVSFVLIPFSIGLVLERSAFILIPILQFSSCSLAQWTCLFTF